MLEPGKYCLLFVAGLVAWWTTVFTSPTTVSADDSTLKTKTESRQRTVFDLRDGDRVVMLGGTFIERAQKYGHLETAMTALHPDRTVSFRNLGWSGDTVWADSRGIFDPPRVGYGRMIKQLAELKPTLVIVAYGMNESHAGEAGLQKFRGQLNVLLDAVEKTGADIALISPHRFEKPPAPLPDATQLHFNLELYSSAMQTIAKDRGYPFADLFREYKATSPLTDNGIHFHSDGYQRITEILLERFNMPFQKETISIRVDGKKNPVQFETTGLHLPWSGQTIRVAGLSPGDYEIKVDDEVCATASAKELADGVPIKVGPDVRQLEKLRDAVVRKNRLYFYRWRPQNITYLFGFRKHEQGNNAKDVAEFEPLVKKVEAEIAELKQPVKRTIEVVKSEGGQR